MAAIPVTWTDLPDGSQQLVVLPGQQLILTMAPGTVPAIHALPANHQAIIVPPGSVQHAMILAGAAGAALAPHLVPGVAPPPPAPVPVPAPAPAHPAPAAHGAPAHGHDPHGADPHGADPHGPAAVAGGAMDWIRRHMFLVLLLVALWALAYLPLPGYGWGCPIIPGLCAGNIGRPAVIQQQNPANWSDPWGNTPASRWSGKPGTARIRR